MAEEYDWEIYDAFKEQLDVHLPYVEGHILALDKKEFVIDSLDELFRFFHNSKATSSYLSLTPLNELVSKAESILSTLREKKEVVQEDIIEWLLQIEDQMLIYSNQMKTNQRILSPLPHKLLDTVSVITSDITPLDTLKNLNILYLDKNVQRAKQIVPFLRTLAKSVTYSNESNEDNTCRNFTSFDIILSNLDLQNKKVIECKTKKFPLVPIIVVYDKVSPILSKELLIDGVSHIITNPLKKQILERELVSIVKVFYPVLNIIISNKKINEFIQTLEPLPSTMFQIIQICDDDDIPIKELIKTVKTDPIVAGNILKVANSPIYGSVEISTVDQAVSRFGKTAIKALSLSGLHNSLGSINLSPYQISEDTFSKISMLRLSLMIKWYSKVCIADLSILSSTAMLSNIGQLLISKELLALQKESLFIKLCETTNPTYAEEYILHTTTTTISAAVLKYWKLSNTIIDIVEYSDNPTQAPSDIQALCVANHIVNALIDNKCRIATTIPDDILLLLSTYNLDIGILDKALASIQEI